MPETDHGGRTQFGFDWGPAQVTRMSFFRGIRVVGIKTQHHDLQISVSRTGRSVRVWRDGKELTDA